jgi:beta-glucuronidase
MLYPHVSKTRTVVDLSGIWNVKFDFKEEGLKKNWGKRVPQDREVAVPSSYNDLYTEMEIHNHMGGVWFSRDFLVPAEWQGKLVHLRFESATYRATVWVNGKELGGHEGGYTPFEFEISELAKFGAVNQVVVRTDYLLNADTIPQGNLNGAVLGGYAAWHQNTVPSVPFDFFPYGGLNRPVKIYCTERDHVADLTVKTDIVGKQGIVKYEIVVAGKNGATVEVSVGGAKGEAKVVRGKAVGSVTIKNCRFWSHLAPNLYDLTVHLKDKSGELLDEYTLPIGVRTVKVKGNRLLLNGKPVYFKGFGRHEDMDIAGKGLNLPYLIRDFNLMRWIGANSFRTSHYPYSDEQMQMTDRQGFLVCTETPAVCVSLRAATPKTLKAHLQALREMYDRDKNHPSVIMWSLGDEDEKGEPNSLAYFTKLTREMRKLDDTRPVTKALTLHPRDDKISQLFDLIIFNVYACWYSIPGRLELLDAKLEDQVGGYWRKFHKPILIGEFGADSFPGLDWLPSLVWSEEYHSELVEKTIAWFRKKPYIIGEQIWVFADFKCAQEGGRAILNRKGVFTRARQPKAVAHTLRRIWAQKDPF